MTVIQDVVAWVRTTLLEERDFGDCALTTLIADPTSGNPRKFLVDVDATLEHLLEREDSDRNQQITIEDVGPKVCLDGLNGVWRKWC